MLLRAMGGLLLVSSCGHGGPNAIAASGHYPSPNHLRQESLALSAARIAFILCGHFAARSIAA